MYRTALLVIFIALSLLTGAFLRVEHTDWNKAGFEKQFATKLGGDEVGYDMSVRQWIEKGFYGFAPFAYSGGPNAFTTPVYPLFLMLCYKVFGYGDSPPIAAIQGIQIIVDLASALLLYSLAKRLLHNRLIACAVMLLYAVHPTFTHLPSFLLTETLYIFIMLLFLHALLSVLHTDGSKAANYKTGLLAGLLFAALILTRPAVAPFALVLAPYLLWMVWRKRISAYCVLMVGIGFLLIMSPWWIRNEVTLHKPVLLAEQAGNPLLWGTYPYQDNPHVDVGENPDKMGQMAMDRIIHGFRTQPNLYLNWYTVGKSQVLTDHVYIGFSAEEQQNVNRWHRIGIYLGACGLLFSLLDKKRRHDMGWITLFALVSFAVYLPFAPTPRYFVPVLPFVFLGICYLMDLLFRLSKHVKGTTHQTLTGLNSQRLKHL